MSDTLHDVEVRVLKRMEEEAKKPKPTNPPKDSRVGNTIPAVIASCL